MLNCVSDLYLRHLEEQILECVPFVCNVANEFSVPWTSSILLTNFIGTARACLPSTFFGQERPLQYILYKSRMTAQVSTIMNHVDRLNGGEIAKLLVIYVHVTDFHVLLL